MTAEQYVNSQKAYETQERWITSEVIKIANDYTHQETESLRKELEEVRNLNFEIMEISGLKDRENDRYTRLWVEQKAKAAKLVEALEDIRAVEFNGECGSIAYRALSQYESNGEGEGNESR